MKDTANAEQVRLWNELGGPAWVRWQKTIDAQVEAIGLAGIDALDPAAGEHVLDVGCGCGHTVLELARRVGERGRVLGVDVSEPMLALAQQRAASQPQASFVRADAQTHAFEEGAFDAAFSRFGVMFFADPAAAYSNLRRSLKPKGRVRFLAWQPMNDNEWISVPMQVVRKHLPEVEEPNGEAPGPFALANRERTRAWFEQAGFANVSVEPLDGEMAIAGGQSLEAAVDFYMEFGFIGRAIQSAPDELRSTLKNALAGAFEPHRRGAGVVLKYAALQISAENI